jgi:integrase
LSYKQAIKQAQEWAGAGRTAPDKFTVADAVAFYLDTHYAKEGRAPQKTASLFNTHVLPTLGARPVAALETAELEGWLQELATAPRRVRGGTAITPPGPDAVRARKATANRILAQLKAALNVAYQAGKVASDDAWRRVKPFKRADAPKIRYLSIAECRRLLDACNAEFQPLVRAALFTGCRYGELVALKTSDFDAASGTLYIANPKGGRPRHVPLTAEGRDWFGVWAAAKTGGEPIFTRTGGTAWKASNQQYPLDLACKAAGIPPIRFHDLRHTYASTLATAGVPLQVIAAALGHASTRMTERHYAHLAPNAVAAAIQTHLPALSHPAPGSNAIPIRKAA